MAAESFPVDTPGGPAKIAPATWRDLGALRTLEKVCFPKDAWPLFDLIGVLTLPNVVRLKATIGEQMVGFVAGDIRNSENLAWIVTIAVLPEYRGLGIAAGLLETCESRLMAPAVRLSVRRSNHSAIRLYRKAGYSEVGIWDGYYHDGEDALVMEKRLP